MANRDPRVGMRSEHDRAGGLAMKKPRVLYICHNHVSAAAGGVEVYALELYEALRAAGTFEPLLLARTGAPHTANVSTHQGTALSAVGSDPNQYLFFTDLNDYDALMLTNRSKHQCIRFFRDFLQTCQPDLIHFHHTLFLGVEFLVEARHTLPNTPIVYTLHEYVPICHNHGQMIRTRSDEPCLEASPQRCHGCFPDIPPQMFFLRSQFVKAHFAAVDQFVAPSRFLMERFVDWGIPRDNILLEEYGRTLMPAAPAVSREGGGTRFGFFGRLSHFKGITVLLEAVRLLMERPSALPPDGFHVLIHGAGLEFADDSFRQRFHRLLDETATHVTYVGPYATDQLPRLMEEIDWVVVPSVWWENSPLVIQEAFANRQPVICSDIGGMAEKVTDGVNGLHFRAGHPWSLAETMTRAMKSRELRNRLAAGVPPMHAMAGHVDTLTRLYHQLLKGVAV